MTLPLSLTQPLRQGQLNIGAGWRAHFAPFNQALAVTNSSTLLGPTIYDYMVAKRFLDGAPIAPWTDLGWVTKFKFTPGSKIGTISSGYRMAARAKYRGDVAEKLAFTFEESTRWAYKIATGNAVINILATTQPSIGNSPFGSSGTPAVPMGASGYIATGLGSGPTQGLPTLFVPAGSGASFPAGTYIVCDQDYNTSQFGFVGDAAANVFPGAVQDVDFIRKTSDYVAMVLQVVPSAVSGQDALILNQKMVGGGNNALSADANTSPSAGAKVQALVGYGTRGGGTTITEWSGIFVLDTIDGSQLLRYYPRLAPDAEPGMNGANVEGITSLQKYSLEAALEAMAFDDPWDGETVVSYEAYFPRGGQQIAY